MLPLLRSHVGYEEIGELREEISKLKKEVLNERQQKEEFENKLTDAKNEEDASKRRLEQQLRNQMNESFQLFFDQKSDEWQQQCEKLNKQTHEWQQKYETLNQSLDQKNQECAKLQEQIHSHKQDYQSLTETLEQECEEYDNLEEKLYSFQQDCRAKSKRIDEMLVVENWMNELRNKVNEEINQQRNTFPLDVTLSRQIKSIEKRLSDLDNSLRDQVYHQPIQDSTIISNLIEKRNLLRTDLINKYNELDSVLKRLEQEEMRKKVIRFYDIEFAKYLANNPSNIPHVIDENCLKKQHLSEIYSHMSKKDRLIQDYEALVLSYERESEKLEIIEVKLRRQKDQQSKLMLQEDKNKLEPILFELRSELAQLEEEAFQLKEEYPEIIVEMESINNKGYSSIDPLLVRFRKWAISNGIFLSNTQFHDYDERKIIHNGLTTVYTAKKNNKNVVLKCFTIESVEMYDAVVNNELSNMIKLSPHDRIAKLNGVFCDEERREIYLEMPYYSSGNLRQYLQSLRERIKLDGNQLISCREILRKLLRMIVETMQYITSKNIIHRDIKMENILISENGNIVMADFGSSKKIMSVLTKSSMTFGIGTQNYMAPEIMAGTKAPNEKSDIWSMGVVMLESWSILEGKFDDNLTYFNSSILSYDENRNVILPQVTTNDVQGKLLVELLNRIFNASTPEDRPSAMELITEEDYFTKGGELVTDFMQESGIVISFGEERVQKWISKLKLLKTKLKSNEKQTIVLRRNHILEDVSENLLKIVNYQDGNLSSAFQKVYQSTIVKFEGESGIDQGALSNEMYTKYLECCLKHPKLFTSQSENQVENFVPSQSIDIDEFHQNLLLCMGYMLKKIIFDCDEKSIYIPFNDLLFKYLIEMSKVGGMSSTSSMDCNGYSNSDINFGRYDKSVKEQIRFWSRFIEQFDSDFLNNLLSLRRLNNQELNAVTCEESFIYQILDKNTQQLVDVAHDLTCDNVDLYILQQMRNQMFSPAQRFKMSLISQGFNKYSIERMRKLTISQILENDSDWFDESRLGIVEIKLLLSGSSYIDANILLNQMDFSSLSENSQANMTMLVTSLTKTQLREFLIWMTSLSSIPLKGLPKKIKMKSSHRFFAHACSTVLNFEVNEEEEDYDTFRDQFMKLLNNVAVSTQEE